MNEATTSGYIGRSVTLYASQLTATQQHMKERPTVVSALVILKTPFAFDRLLFADRKIRSTAIHLASYTSMYLSRTYAFQCKSQFSSLVRVVLTSW
jgi:hypothetical protein